MDAKWKIELFRQGKKHIANFMIKFEVLAMKAEADDMYAIFLLKKNIRTNIIKTILEYLPMAVLVKIVNGGLYFIFPFHFYFSFHFIFLFNFLFLEQLGLGFISHAVTSVTI